ncbi:MAG: zinc-binding dehydrogenase [Patulibacter sp.]|nr:zinc-binding dehydrogenase [Patulibacter sp.]
MRVVAIPRTGGFDVLTVEQRPDPPAPAADQVTVEVHAAGVNFADVMARMGLYADAPPLPAVVGYEVAGTVAAVGADVAELAVGDRVFAGTRFGGYAERVTVPASDVNPLPDHLSFAEGAAIPVNYATAWAGLYGYGSLRPGERVLIHAAAGGVGIAATQLAVPHGVEIWGTASPGKHDAIREQGVEHPLDYRQKGWERGLPPFDVILDAVGGASLRRSYRMLRPGGRVIAFGASSVVAGEKRNLRAAVPQALRMIRGFNLIDQLSESKAVIGLNMLRLWDDRGSLDEWVTPLRAGIEDGTIRPIVAAEIPFDRAADAHRMLQERRNVGKVVLVP